MTTAQLVVLLPAVLCAAAMLGFWGAAVLWRRRRRSPRGQQPGAEVTTGVIFADLQGYTALTEQEGDRHAAYLAARFTRLAQRACVGDAHVVKTAGDGVMIIARGAEETLQSACAVAELVNQDRGLPPVAIGATYGRCVRTRADVFGATVNLAARLAGAATPGEVWCTEELFLAAAPSAHGEIPLVEVELDGIARPVAVRRVDRAFMPAARLRDLASHGHPLCLLRPPSLTASKLNRKDIA